MSEQPPAPAKYTIEQAHRDILKLNDERIAQLNRILATEAMVKTLLAELPPDLLATIAERYDLRLVHAMEQMPAGQHRPHLWEHYSEKLQELIAKHKRNQPQTPL